MSNTITAPRAIRRTTAIKMTLASTMSKYFNHLFSDDNGNVAQVIGHETNTGYFKNGEYINNKVISYTVEITHPDRTFSETNPMSFKVVRRYLAENGYYRMDFHA